MEEIKKPCPHCKTEINEKANRCPHCHGKIYRWTKERKIMAVVFTGIILLVIFGRSDTPPPTRDSSTVTAPKVRDEITVCTEASLLIKKMLKSPSTADFPTCSNFVIQKLSNDGYRVNSYVDSQNGFGATIRTEWSIVFYYIGGGLTRTDLVIFDGETIYRQ